MWPVEEYIRFACGVDDLKVAENWTSVWLLQSDAEC